MSASHRKLARLPVEIFDNLSSRPRPHRPSSAQLRQLICKRLSKKFPAPSSFSSIETVGGILRLSPIALVRLVDPLLTFEEAENLLSRICCHCTPRYKSAYALLHSIYAQGAFSHNFLPTGIESLDKALQGGFRFGTVSEVFGRSGVGKTQLALQLCTIAARHNLGSIYVDTEKKMSLRRLKEIAENRANEHLLTQDRNGAGFSYNDSTQSQQESDPNTFHADEGGDPELPYKSPLTVLDNLMVHNPSTTQDLLNVLESVQDYVLNRNREATTQKQKLPIGLLIVDSIASPMQRDFGAGSAPQRATALFQCSRLLKRLADQLHLVVLTINQRGGTDHSKPDNAHDGAPPLQVRAGLGTSWHHCVTSRLLIENLPCRTAEVDSSLGQIGDKERDRLKERVLHVVKSNLVGLTTIPCSLSTVGLVESSFDELGWNT